MLLHRLAIKSPPPCQQEDIQLELGLDANGISPSQDTETLDSQLYRQQ